MKAHILINILAGKARDVIDKIGKIEGIKHVSPCWGRPDIFAFADVENEKALADTVLAKIQTIDGIESTDTHIVID